VKAATVCVCYDITSVRQTMGRLQHHCKPPASRVTVVTDQRQTMKYMPFHTLHTLPSCQLNLENLLRLFFLRFHVPMQHTVSAHTQTVNTATVARHARHCGPGKARFGLWVSTRQNSPRRASPDHTLDLWYGVMLHIFIHGPDPTQTPPGVSYCDSLHSPL
jgi:hypothetical protein